MKFKTILILVAVVLGVASGCETVCTDKTVGGKWVSSSCTSNGTEPLTVYEKRASGDAPMMGGITYRLANEPIIGDKPTYVVEVTRNASCPESGLPRSPQCGNIRHAFFLDKEKSEQFACEGSEDNCAWVYDLAESLNEAHRRRVK